MYALQVLLASNHRTFFDFFIITVNGLWASSGASLFSLYPVRTASALHATRMAMCDSDKKRMHWRMRRDWGGERMEGEGPASEFDSENDSDVAIIPALSQTTRFLMGRRAGLLCRACPVLRSRPFCTCMAGHKAVLCLCGSGCCSASPCMRLRVPKRTRAWPDPFRIKAETQRALLGPAVLTQIVPDTHSDHKNKRDGRFGWPPCSAIDASERRRRQVRATYFYSNPLGTLINVWGRFAATPRSYRSAHA